MLSAAVAADEGVVVTCPVSIMVTNNMAPSTFAITVVRNLASSPSTTTVMTGAAGSVVAMPAPVGKHKPTFPVRPGTAASKSAGSGEDSVPAIPAVS